MSTKNKYPATLNVDYPSKLDRATTFFRPLLSIPIFVILALITGSGGFEMAAEKSGEVASSGGGGIAAGLFFATLLMILFQQKYPKWWFEFNLELNRFSNRVAAYLLLLTDQYPSTDETQAVHMELEYPDAKKDLNRWLPLVKWILAIPHFIALIVLSMAAIIVTIIAWFSIIFTGVYPKSLFDFVVGVGRWGWRVTAYAVLLTTDEYPPFSLQ